jgi:deoxyribodipyrimidine photo-lyase
MQSSHLSAWLAHGCISPRQIWWDTLQYEQDVEANESTYWLRFELLWREYFRWYSRASDWTLFRRTGPSDQVFGFDQNARRFERWKTGHTDCDIVDAAMRELNQTGWMSNRARQLVASHLIYESNLGLAFGCSLFRKPIRSILMSASNWGKLGRISLVSGLIQEVAVFSIWMIRQTAMILMGRIGDDGCHDPYQSLFGSSEISALSITSH